MVLFVLLGGVRDRTEGQVNGVLIVNESVDICPRKQSVTSFIFPSSQMPCKLNHGSLAHVETDVDEDLYLLRNFNTLH